MSRLLLTGTLLALLGGCGQKGPLYLPDKNAAVVSSVPAASPVPPPPTPSPPKKSDAQDGDTPPK
jgi:predicted small lipoprotein YifL